MGLQRRSLGVCCLCLALLLHAPSWVSAQASKQEGGSSSTASSSKRSSIIPSAGETDLVNGIGDVKPDGGPRGWCCCLGGGAAAVPTGRLLGGWLLRCSSCCTRRSLQGRREGNLQGRHARGRQGAAVLGEAHQADAAGQHSRCASGRPGLLCPSLCVLVGRLYCVCTLLCVRTPTPTYLALCGCAGRAVSDKCQQEVAAYKIERSKHINKDVALGEPGVHQQQQALLLQPATHLGPGLATVHSSACDSLAGGKWEH